MKYSPPLKKQNMADALTAPQKKVEIVTIWEGEIAEQVEKGSKEHKALSQEFDHTIKYMFELAQQNPERDLPVINMVTKRPISHVKFSPYRNLILTSQIVWKGQRRTIRYYDGCSTIFSDKQPKDKELIDTLIKQSRPQRFIDGKCGFYGDDKMLLLYMNICSWNGESEFRTRTAEAVFIPVNQDKQASLESSKLDAIETALKYAKEASELKMRIHCDYIGISTIDYDSGNDLTEKELRTKYRKEASRNPEEFIRTYGNKAIEIKYYIDRALREGLISNKFNPNKATWGRSNTEICDISGLKSPEAISQKLFEFSQLEEGEEFVIQLKTLFEK